MALRSTLVSSLLALASLAPAVELGWSGAPGAQPPPGWSVAAASDASVAFVERAMEMTVLSGRQALAVAAIDLPDGSDARPLRLSAVVSASGLAAVDGYPALVALEWGGGPVFAVGLGVDPHTRKDERRAWAVWSGGGRQGSDHAESELAPGASPAHLRIVLTASEVAAYGSPDGWAWTRIAGVRRQALGALGAPARVVVGRGLLRAGAAGLAADPPGAVTGAPCVYRFADLRIENGPAEVPASALKDYARKDSLADTVEALVTVGVPPQWRIRGPEDASRAQLPTKLPAGFTSSGEWKTYSLGESGRFIPLGQLLPGGGNTVRWAATTLAVDEPGWTRFCFDGLRRSWLYVDGRLVSAPLQEVAEAEADRQSATVWLTSGSHEVVLAVGSQDGRAAAILRHEPGDPRARIALLRRLAIDFPGDEQVIDAPFEIARLWEGLGFAREAVGALAEVIDAEPETAERALAERARLLLQLGDEAAATAEIEVLQRRWAEGDTDQLALARRSARLWQRLGVPERALGLLGEALKLPDLDGVTRCSLLVERARLRRVAGEEAAVAADLRLAAMQLPEGDGARFDLLCAAARLDPALSTAAVEQLGRLATDAQRARQLAGLHAARLDEPSRLAARRLAATLPGTALALPAIELAEDLVATNDQAGALGLYQAELARRSLPAATDLAAARVALARAVLAETPAGAALLAESGGLPPSWPAQAAGAPADRAAAVQSSVDLARTLLATGRTEEAWALARTIIACWPEQSDRNRELARRIISQSQGWKSTPAALLELTGWFDAVLADRHREDLETSRWIQENLTGRLVGVGLAEEALARLRRQQLTSLDLLTVAMSHLYEADLWLGMGFPRAAAAAVQRGREAAPGEAAIERAVDQRRSYARGITGDRLVFSTPSELSTLLRTAERALAGDPERAARDFQTVVEGPSDQPIRLAGGSLPGAATFAAARLRQARPEVRQSWLDANGARAAAALLRAVSDDPAALDAISSRWPLAPAAGEALRRQADLWAERGAWRLAAGTAMRCLAEHPAEDQGRLLLRAAHAAARVGDSAGLEALLARLTGLTTVPAWDGRRLPAGQLAAALRALLPPAVAVADPERLAVQVRLAAYAPALRPETAADARPPLPAAAFADGLLLVATPDDLVGVAADGTLRWQLAAGRDRGLRGPELASAGESSLATDAGVVVVGLRRHGQRRLVAAETAGGRQLWSSGEIPELARAILASAPTIAEGRVWAWFVEQNRAFVACLTARDGTVLWRSTLGTGPLRQPFKRGGDYVATGNCAAPALHGRELFVATDAGQVGAFDAVDGRLIWLHQYLRTTLDPVACRSAYRRLLARGRGRLLVDAERVYLAPRDSLGILALDRATGVQAWAAELADVDGLVALTPAGLVASGPAVTLYQPSSGAQRWRWRPASGERPGLPALSGDGLWVPLRSGPVRLALADGSSRHGPAWSGLGLATPPGALLASGGRLLALADGLVGLPVPGAGTVAEVTVRAGGAIQPLASGATPAGAAVPSALAVNWELPVGRVSALWELDGGEVCLIAADRLYKVEAASGRSVWTAAAPAGGLRSITWDATSLLLVGDGVLAVYDRASGRLRWTDPFHTDPVARVRSQDPYVKAILDGGVVVRWISNEGRLQVREAGDGALRCTVAVSSDVTICDVMVAGDELHLLCLRGKELLMEVRSLTDGRRLQEVPLGIRGVPHGSLGRLPGGGTVICSRAGGAFWDAARREAKRFDLDLETIHRVERDGGNLVLAGQTERSFRAAFLDAAGKTLAQEEFTQNADWNYRLPLAPRIVAGLRVQMYSRNGQTGFLVRTVEGGEKAWLPLREASRSWNYGLLPLAGKALSFTSHRDGRLRVHLLDPQAGKIEIEGAFGLTMSDGVQPVAAAGAALVPTTRGLVSLVAVAGPAPLLPGRALGESNQAVWRMARPLVVDGLLDEWEGQAGWEQDPLQSGRGGAPALDRPLAAWAARREDAIALAISIPLPPASAHSTVVALELAREGFQGSALPLLLSLDWEQGKAIARVLHRPLPNGPLEAPLQVRAASDGTSLSWELLIPSTMIYPMDEHRARSDGLRWGALVDPGLPGGGAYELGSGLHPALDKAGFIRLHWVDAKPGPQEPQPKEVEMRRGGKRSP